MRHIAIHKLTDVKHTLGFFSMTIAWALMNILHSVYLGWTHGKADDSGVVIFWSGLFMTIAWAVFIIYPLNKLDHSKWLFKPQFFSLITAIYAALAYSVIVGGLFRSMDLVMMFLPLALLTGLIFGITYSLIIRSERVVDLLYTKSIAKLLFFLSPAIILFVFLWLFPTIAPSVAFRYMPDEIRDKIVRQTIPKYKAGDSFEELNDALPGYFEYIDNGVGNTAQSMDGFAFVLQVNCGKIIRLEYGKDQSEFDATIYGKLQEQPCP